MAIAQSDSLAHRRLPLILITIGLALILAHAIALHIEGHQWIAPDGLRFWAHAGTADESQQIFDWYSLSHIIHGFLFYGLLWLVARRLPVGVRALIALAIEVTWETLENSPLIINRYHEATISQAYLGDSVINSLSDITCMLIGFTLARFLPVWLSILVVIGLELLDLYVIRDSLTINIIMLIHPIDAIRVWQQGG